MATNDGGEKVIRMTMAVPQLPQVAMAQQMYTQFGINITDLTVDFHTNANPVVRENCGIAAGGGGGG